MQTAVPGINSYLSIAHKKAYPLDAAITNKATVDLALISEKNGNNQFTYWYNMSGKDGKVAAALTGTTTGINFISFDRQQFDKCKTTQDLQRMTGYITATSFSHFAVISNIASERVLYPCFIFQFSNGKRGLIWVQPGKEKDLTVIVRSMK